MDSNSSHWMQHTSSTMIMHLRLDLVLGKSKETKRKEIVYWKQYVCSKEGETDETWRKTNEIEERDRGKTRTWCNAKLTVCNDGSNYVVKTFNEEHNHPPTTPSKVHLLRSQRTVSTAKKNLIQDLRRVDIPIYQQFELFQTQAGGHANVCCTERDLRNVVRDEREEVKGHDVDILYEHFKAEQEKDPDFFFEFYTDEENRLLRCFWIDSIGKKSYTYFGDVVVFDTTYNTNRYKMIFAPIVAMPKSAPNVIITDQDQAISKAIAHVLPNTIHRYCVWHILKKFPEKTNVAFMQDYYELFKTCIWDSECPEEFEKRWFEALEKSEQTNNEWLEKMYELRGRWIPAYVNKYFSAGMSSS
ncbi:protein FAR1-RELATED SEQUENCE 5-like [Rosa rugosa]|uniref:protein FAR1-RELATED SEQUENCE 5-like n=1 Tax=Rosa rugosa TaxID=74645 RepID=UPI002B410BE8|nr:protein FAR1-RELATED SEQUENCE 5-like [Rosa rugosa]